MTPLPPSLDLLVIPYTNLELQTFNLVIFRDRQRDRKRQEIRT